MSDVLVIIEPQSQTLEIVTQGPQGVPGAAGQAGPAGPPGQGVPTGGTTGQVLAKASSANYDTQWVTGGSSGVSSVFTRTGAVTAQNGDYTASQITNVPEGAVTALTVQTAINELDGDIATLASTTISALALKYDASNPDGFVNSAGAAAAAPVQSVAGRTGAVTLAKADVGLSNVDNTSDINKPVSTAQASADAAVQAFSIQRSNHTGTQAISTVTGLQAALDGKQPLATVLTNTTASFTTAQETKLAGIEANADVTDSANVAAAGAVMESDYSPSHSILVQQSGTGSPTALQIGNNTLVGRLSGGGSVIDDLSATDVRTLLSINNVNNTSDADKPVSTATQSALDLKAPLASPAFTGTVTGITAAMVGAPSGSGTSTGTNTGDQTSVTGNAGTATALQTARTINGVSFDGTANITVSAAAGTLTGTALPSGVITSSLTAVGTIATGVWQGTAITDSYIASAATWNAKQNAITFGTGVQTALSVNVGTAGSPVINGGALGTPSSGNLANCTFPTLNQNTTGSAATLTTGRTIAMTGDVSWTSPAFNGSGNVTAASTLATVNSNVGSFGSATQVATFTVNGKGLITAASNSTISIPATAISDSTAAGREMVTAATAAAQTALLDTFTSGAKGLAPASGGGTTNFLRADGTWAVPPSAGGFNYGLVYATSNLLRQG